MIRFTGRGILLDIEGTTSSIGFVYDVLFPYARRELEPFLRAHGSDPEVRAVCERLLREAGRSDSGAAHVVVEAHRLMDQDAKTTGLKELQGLIWQKGYRSGVLRSQVFPDVVDALARWRQAGLDVRIYSSGSALAQKLFFAHTEHGDLTPLLRGHYDTTTGPKRADASYRIIAADMKLPPAEILFLSDVPAELDAAREAGMQTALVLRPGNATFTAPSSHPSLSSFSEIQP